MGLQAKPLISATKDTLPQEVVASIDQTLTDLVDQINAQPAIAVGAAQPNGQDAGDLFVLIKGTTVSILVKGARSYLPLTLPDLDGVTTRVTNLEAAVLALQNSVTALQSGTINGTHFKGSVTTTTPATTLTTDKDWAFIINAGVLSLSYNQAGTIKKVNLT